MTGGTRALLTCRYWAFGTGCPNTQDNKNICSFAHWDTGILASAFDQRGTCKKWTNGICKNGNECYYEHRVTGVEGMYQGRPDLRGFNNEVKVAAQKAGFDIGNHDGLYNLIWAVKRVALRAAKNANIDQRPPKDPVYPDRFRPSGFRDNTKRKRPAQAAPPSAPLPVTLEPKLKAKQGQGRKFRCHNKKTAAASTAATVPTAVLATSFDFTAQGTFCNPIELADDNDDKEDELKPVAKKQKLQLDTTANTKPVANTSYPRTAPEILARDSCTISPESVQQDNDAQDAMQIDGHTYIRTNSGPRPGCTASQRTDADRARLLKNQLTKVESAMEGSVNHMNWCKNSMNNIFVEYRELLAGPHVHPLLDKLDGSIGDAKAAAFRGAEVLKDVIELVT